MRVRRRVSCSSFQLKPVVSIPEKLQQPTVTENLKLLPNLRPDVFVPRVQGAEAGFESVEIDQAEFCSPNFPDARQDVRHPSPGLRGGVPQK